MLKLPANGNQAESPKLKDAGDAIKRAQEQLSSLGDLLDIPSPGRAKTEAQALLIIDNPSFAPEPSPRSVVTSEKKKCCICSTLYTRTQPFIILNQTQGPSHPKRKSFYSTNSSNQPQSRLHILIPPRQRTESGGKRIPP